MGTVVMEELYMVIQQIQLWGIGILCFLTVMVILLLGQVTRILVKLDQIVNYLNVQEEEEE
ncbi:MAG: hypothetical protein ACQEQC_00440 [Elusimicrobiota bacterium]